MILEDAGPYIAAAVAVAAAVTAWVKARAEKTRVPAEVRQLLAAADGLSVATATEVVALVNAQLAGLRHEINELRAKVDRYRARVAAATIRERDLERRIAHLETFIRAQGWSIPPES